MKITIITEGNPETGDPHHFTNIYVCDYFTIEAQEDNGYWINLWGCPKCPEKQPYLPVGYDPDIDTLIVMP